MPRPMDPRVVVLGKIRSAVGLQGWVKIESYTDPAANILDYRTWQLRLGDSKDDRWRAIKVLNGRTTGQGVQVQLEGIADRNAAELLRNTDIGVYRHELPSPGAGEYYWDDLVGLSGYTVKGEALGELDHFVDTPAHPMMVFVGRTQGGKRTEHWVPVVKGKIVEVNFEARRMTLDWTLDWAE